MDKLVMKRLRFKKDKSSKLRNLKVEFNKICFKKFGILEILEL